MQVVLGVRGDRSLIEVGTRSDGGGGGRSDARIRRGAITWPDGRTDDRFSHEGVV
jgi:hypothetical protein